MLTLNNQQLTRQELQTQAQKSHQTAWEASLWNFIKNWLDENDYVEVKTSGSTGTPKIIRLEKKRMIASAKATGEFFRLQRKNKVLLYLLKYIINNNLILKQKKIIFTL